MRIHNLIICLMLFGGCDKEKHEQAKLDIAPHLHEIPPDCERQNYEDVLADTKKHRMRCAAHAYGRGCSVHDGSSASELCCDNLLRLVDETKDPAILEIAEDVGLTTKTVNL